MTRAFFFVAPNPANSYLLVGLSYFDSVPERANELLFIETRTLYDVLRGVFLLYVRCGHHHDIDQYVLLVVDLHNETDTLGTG